MPPKTSNLKLVVQSVLWMAILFALPFVGAGTFAWREGWAFIILQFGAWAAMTLWLRKNNPELIRVRAELWKRTVKTWDKVIMICLFAGFFLILLIPGIDTVRYKLSHIPLVLKLIGFLGIIVSNGLMFWPLKVNPYLSAAVEIQKDRGHKVITTGPYQYVRHPMYVGAILWAASIPLALGSVVAFIPVILLIPLVLVRAYLEDKTLYNELDGYAAYTKKVKYRLIPGVW